MLDLAAKPKSHYRRFDKYHAPLLRDSLRDFLRCEVSIISNPTTRLRQLGIDIETNPERLVYPDSGRVIILVGPTKTRPQCPRLAVVLSKPELVFAPNDLLNHLGLVLRSNIDRAAAWGFNVDPMTFGAPLWRDVLTDHLCTGGINPHALRLVLDMMDKARGLRFENRTFDTGLLFTRSYYSYRGNNRGGRLIALHAPITLKPTALEERRFWYLADGNRSYFVVGRTLKIGHMFFLDESGQAPSASPAVTLRRTLQGHDLGFRTTSGRDLTVVTASGDEYCYDGVKWTHRNYDVLIAALRRAMPMAQSTAGSLRGRLKTFVRTGKFPPLAATGHGLQRDTVIHNALLNEPMDLAQAASFGLLDRMCSSDGALVIDPTGRLVAFGAIARLDSAAAASEHHVTGAGQMAAEWLSRSGAAIKVSQDGVAKVFLGGQLAWVV